MENKNEFIVYEYMQLCVHEEDYSYLLDSYKNFGWILDQNIENDTDEKIQTLHKRSLYLKRNKAILNRMELTRLQQNFQNVFEEIKILKQKKKLKATIKAILVGLVGTFFMALSVFAITSSTPNLFLCVLFAIPAFIAWTLPLLIYPYELKRQGKLLDPIILSKEEELDFICKKGHNLL